MDSDNDSEISDFWQDFSEKAESPCKLLSSLDFIENSPVKNKPAPVFYLEQTVNNLRNSKKEAEVIARLDEQATMRNYIQFSIERLKNKFQIEVAGKVTDNALMKRQLYYKSKDFEIIRNFLIDREVTITELRRSLVKKSEAKVANLNRKEELRALNKELSLVQVKIEALRRAIVNMEESCKTNKVLLAESLVELSEVKKSTKIEYQELEAEKNRIFSVKNVENLKLAEELRLFKEIKLKELEHFESNCEKNSEIILSLQDELKNAKKVLQRPELRNQIYDRLQDYIDKYDSKSPSPISTKNSTIFRRKVYSKKAILTGNTSGEIQKNLSPKVSKFKFYSRKPTLSGKTLHFQSSHKIRLHSAKPPLVNK